MKPDETSEKIWDTVPEDYKGMVEGKRYVLARSERGTVLTPVNSKTARETWGKYAGV